MQSKREGLVGLIIELSKIFCQYQEKCIPDVTKYKFRYKWINGLDRSGELTLP